MEYLAVGKHIICDMQGIEFEKLDDLRYLMDVMMKAVKCSKGTCVNVQFKKFEPTGLSILCLLEESHLSIHTYPDNNGTALLDCFTCGTKCTPDLAMQYLIAELKPTKVKINSLDRGFDLPS